MQHQSQVCTLLLFALVRFALPRMRKSPEREDAGRQAQGAQPRASVSSAKPIILQTLISVLMQPAGLGHAVTFKPFPLSLSNISSSMLPTDPVPGCLEGQSTLGHATAGHRNILQNFTCRSSSMG